MRCFVAVDMPAKLTGKISQLQKELIGLDTKLVERQNLHFTLKFLGEVDEDFVKKVKNALKDAASTNNRFQAALKGVGVFPDENFIRVVWVGCEDLIKLQNCIDKALPMPKKEISSPHLTLARFRSQKYNRQIKDFISRHKNETIGTFSVREIKLKKSTLFQGGPKYDDIEVFKLGD